MSFMSCYPGGSKALGVLLAFQSDICVFVSVRERCSLFRASWWLYHAREEDGRSAAASWPTETELNALAQRLHARLPRGRSRRTRASLSVGQVHVLVRDLLLVASGLRTSCLVDCCALSKELAEQLLRGLENESELCRRWRAATSVRAVVLDGNVFFVNVAAFVHSKMATGDQQMYVDVSASLSRPKLMTSSSETETSRRRVFASWTVDACKKLLASKSSGDLVLEWPKPSTLNSTALAGILLCYPCVYDILVDDEDAEDEWSEQQNCLAMCPLVLVQTAIFPPKEQLEVPLLAFSVPRRLLDDPRRCNDDDPANSPLVKLLRARCQRQLQLASTRSCFEGLRLQVRGTTRSLPRVAL